jgi:hypothetical protein
MKKFLIFTGIFIVSIYFAANYSGVYSPLIDLNSTRGTTNNSANKEDENKAMPTPKGAPVLLPNPTQPSNTHKNSSTTPNSEPSNNDASQPNSEPLAPQPIPSPSGEPQPAPAPNCVPDPSDPTNSCPPSLSPTPPSPQSTCSPSAQPDASANTPEASAC